MNRASRLLLIIVILLFISIGGCTHRTNVNLPVENKADSDLSNNEEFSIGGNIEEDDAEDVLYLQYKDYFISYDSYIKKYNDYFEKQKELFLNDYKNDYKYYKGTIYAVPFSLRVYNFEIIGGAYNIDFETAKSISSGMSLPEILKLTGESYISSQIYRSAQMNPEFIQYNIDGYGYVTISISSDMDELPGGLMHLSVPLDELEGKSIEEVLTKEKYYSYLNQLLSWKVTKIAFHEGDYLKHSKIE